VEILRPLNLMAPICRDDPAGKAVPWLTKLREKRDDDAVSDVLSITIINHNTDYAR
jgi:hypothetical protein